MCSSRRHLPTGQELLALGCANIIGAFFQSYPVAGSLSRSAIVAATCGTNCTPMHGVFTALFVALVLLLLTGAFRPMPKAILASVVFMAVKSLFDMAKPRFLYRVSTGDFVAWVASFLGTLLIGVPEGIAVGVFTSMALIILRMAHPNYAMLGRLPGSHIFRDIRRYPDAQCIPGLAIFRFDASLCFANIHIFLEALRVNMSDMERKCAAGLSCVVIEFGSINDVDASALRMLQDLHKELKERRVRLLFSSCKVSASDRPGRPLLTSSDCFGLHRMPRIPSGDLCRSLMIADDR